MPFMSTSTNAARRKPWRPPAIGLQNEFTQQAGLSLAQPQGRKPGLLEALNGQQAPPMDFGRWAGRTAPRPRFPSTAASTPGPIRPPQPAGQAVVPPTTYGAWSPGMKPTRATPMGPQPTAPMRARAKLIGQDMYAQGVRETATGPDSLSSLLGPVGGWLSGIGQAINRGADRWNQATAIRLRPSAIGGTPENEASRKRFAQSAGAAARGVASVPDLLASGLTDPRLGQSADRALAAMADLPGQVGSTLTSPEFTRSVARAGDELMGVPQRLASGVTDPRLLQSATSAVQGLANVPSILASIPDQISGNVEGAALRPQPAPLTMVSGAPADPLQQALMGGITPAVLRRDDRSGSIQQLPIVHGQESGSIQQLSGPPRPTPADAPVPFDVVPWQAGMWYGNPDMARLTPGAPLARPDLQNRPAGYGQTLGATPDAMAPASFGPGMGATANNPAAALPSDANLAAEASRRIAQEAQNRLAAETMQAAAGPAFGTFGGRNPRKTYQRTGSPSDAIDYLAGALASKEAAQRGDVAGAEKAWPGAWDARSESSRAYGTPGRTTTQMLSQEQRDAMRARREARRPKYLDPDTRQALVTARAQGRNIAPMRAEIERRVAGGLPLSNEQRTAMSGVDRDLELEKARLGASAAALAGIGEGGGVVSDPLLRSLLGIGPTAVATDPADVSAAIDEYRKQNPSATNADVLQGLAGQADPEQTKRELARRSMEAARSQQERWDWWKNALSYLLGSDTMRGFERLGEGVASLSLSPVAQIPPDQLKRLRQRAAAGDPQAQQLLAQAGR